MTADRLRAVREEADTLRERARRGDDPRQVHNPDKATRGLAFKEVAERAFRSKLANKRIGADHANRSIDRLNKHVAPLIGDRSIKELGQSDYMAAYIEILESVGGPAANRCLTLMQSIVSWALGQGLLEAHPLVRVPQDALYNEEPERRQPILDLAEMRRLWATVQERDSQVAKVMAWLLLTGVRREPARAAKWSEIDLKARTWTVPAERMKGWVGKKREHVVPLSRQAVEFLMGL